MIFVPFFVFIFNCREQLEDSSSSELLATLTNTTLTTVSNIPYIDNDAFTLSGLEFNASDASAEMNESFQFYFAYFILGSLGVLSAMFMLLIWAVGKNVLKIIHKLYYKLDSFFIHVYCNLEYIKRIQKGSYVYIYLCTNMYNFKSQILCRIIRNTIFMFSKYINMHLS